MRRKLIKQGSGGLTIYLPKKWTDQRGLSGGDEVYINEFNQSLIIIPERTKKQKKTIFLTAQKARESTLRTLLVNAYRSGFDIIELQYAGEQKEINTIVYTFLLGFDVFQKEKNIYSIESISEPAANNFDTLLIKQFYILNDILSTMFTKDITDEVHKIQRYDNFLKRSLAQETYTDTSQFFLWQFLSHITQTARLCFHLQKTLGLCEQEIEKDHHLKDCIHTILGMSLFLKKAYLKQDASFLKELHTADENILKKKEKLLRTKNPELAHSLLLIERSLYLANSPLTGLLHTRASDLKH